MPYKDIEARRAASRRHYERNREAMIARATQYTRETRARISDYLRELKTDHPCTDCQLTWPPYVMQFDHIGTAAKAFNVGDFWRGRYSLAAVQAEIAKCELVCANCHAIRTHTRKSEAM
jgi:hypothetical protein